MQPIPSASLSLSCATAGFGGVRAQLRLAGLILAWAASFAGSGYLIRHELLPGGPAAWLVAAIPSLTAVVLVVDYARLLRRASEIHRRIQLNALALGFGGGFFVVCGYSVFERLGAPAAGVDITAVMPILYAAGVLIGSWRQR